MLFMIIERFRDNDMVPIYRRLRDRGRSLPDGLEYIDSWVEPNFARRFQLMCRARKLVSLSRRILMALRQAKTDGNVFAFMRSVSMRHIVNAVFVRGRKVLLGRRSLHRSAYPGLWSFPGGHVEARARA